MYTRTQHASFSRHFHYTVNTVGSESSLAYGRSRVAFPCPAAVLLLKLVKKYSHFLPLVGEMMYTEYRFKAHIDYKRLNKVPNFINSLDTEVSIHPAALQYQSILNNWSD